MKICPNCGNHLKGNEVFCPNCGYDLSQSDDPKTSNVNDQTSGSSDQLGLNSYFDHLERKIASDQPAQSPSNLDEHSLDRDRSDDQASSNRKMNQPSSELQKNYEQSNNTAREPDHSSVSPLRITNYFSWWWQTLRHPAQPLTGSWYFGLISFVINYGLWVLSFRGLMGRFNSLINSFLGGRISVDSAMFENADQSGWGLVVIGLLTWFSYWWLGFGFRKHHQLDFWQYSNQLAALTDLALPLSLVMLVLAELGLSPWAIVFFMAVVIVNVVGLVVSIAVPDRSRLYLAMLAVGLVPLIVIVIFTCIVQIIG